MEQELIETLERIGLTSGEAKAYLALVSVGTSTVGPIIEKSGISASKVYVILDRLILKGLATSMMEKGVKKYSATDPEQLISNLEEEQKKIRENIGAAQKIVPMLKTKKDSVSQLPVAEYAEGVRGYRRLHEMDLDESKDGDLNVTLVNSEVAFLSQAWYPEYVKRLEAKKISQMGTYEHRVWYKKDPKVHKREIRKMFYPKVLDAKYTNLPHITTLGDQTLIATVENGKIFSLHVRSRQLTDAFRRLILIIRDMATVPEGFPDYEIKKAPKMGEK